jgi:membrane protein YqaA with SNARE-associated domain
MAGTAYTGRVRSPPDDAWAAGNKNIERLTNRAQAAKLSGERSRSPFFIDLEDVSFMLSLFGLFASALVAATVLPMQSEAVLAALLIGGKHSIVLLLVVATVGNVLGSVINWVLGRYLLRYREARWFPASSEQLARAQDWYGRWGMWSLLGSWLPIVGDPLTVVAGLMRAPLVPFLALVTFAKGARYIVLAALVMRWF